MKYQSMQTNNHKLTNQLSNTELTVSEFETTYFKIFKMLNQYFTSDIVQLRETPFKITIP